MEEVDLMQLVTTGEHDEVLTTSKIVATEFGKRHDHVMRDIDNLSSDLTKSGMFKESMCKDKYNRNRRCYLINKQGYQYLKNRYTAHKRYAKSNYLYMIKQIGLDGYYKIGITNDIEKRLKQFETVAPIGIELVKVYKTDKAPTIEKKLHNIYKGFNSNLEWYHLTCEQLSKACFYIEQSINNKESA